MTSLVSTNMTDNLELPALYQGTYVFLRVEEKKVVHLPYESEHISYLKSSTSLWHRTANSELLNSIGSISVEWIEIYVTSEFFMPELWVHSSIFLLTQKCIYTRMYLCEHLLVSNTVLYFIYFGTLNIFKNCFIIVRSVHVCFKKRRLSLSNNLLNTHFHS